MNSYNTSWWSSLLINWKAELVLLVDLQRTVYPYKWLPISCRSGADQWKFAGQRPTFYHWATQPTCADAYGKNKKCANSYCRGCIGLVSSPVSIQTPSLALRALRLDGNRAKHKRLRWQAANHGCHCFDRASYWLQAAANRMLGRSSGNHDWLLANASDCVWMETGLQTKVLCCNVALAAVKVQTLCAFGRRRTLCRRRTRTVHQCYICLVRRMTRLLCYVWPRLPVPFF